MTNAINGFAKCGIGPCCRNVFEEVEFAPSLLSTQNQTEPCPPFQQDISESAPATAQANEVALPSSEGDAAALVQGPGIALTPVPTPPLSPVPVTATAPAQVPAIAQNTFIDNPSSNCKTNNSRWTLLFP